MTKSFFITATGTDQGKTLLTTLLCQQLQQQGKKVEALKPVISGFDSGVQTDSARILHSLGREVNAASLKAISPWQFAAPLSPDEAARREGRELSLPEIASFCRQPREVDYLFIEGAGGIMSPLTSKETNLDLAQQLQLPVILVSASYLGCISHILTALEVLKARNITCRHLALLQADQLAQACGITLASLAPHLPAELKILQLNHLASGVEIWKDTPDITAWLESE